jgi:hypothetical protein
MVMCKLPTQQYNPGYVSVGKPASSVTQAERRSIFILYFMVMCRKYVGSEGAITHQIIPSLYYD